MQVWVGSNGAGHAQMQAQTSMKDSVERAVWDIFGDCAPIVLGHYVDGMLDSWQEEHKKKMEMVRWELICRTEGIKTDMSNPYIMGPHLRGDNVIYIFPDEGVERRLKCHTVRYNCTVGGFKWYVQSHWLVRDLLNGR